MVSVAIFLKNGWSVFGTSRNDIISNHPLFTPIKLELGSENSFEQLSKYLPFHLVIHNAAKLPHSLLNEKDIENYYNYNVKGTRYFLEWAKKSKVKTFIFISSTSVISSNSRNFEEANLLSPDLDHYKISKAMGEILCGSYNSADFRTIIYRISAPYGYVSNQSVIPKFIKLAKENRNIELWGSGSRSQVFTFVEDIGYACTLPLDIKYVKGVFNINGNESITMFQLAKLVINVMPKTKSK